MRKQFYALICVVVALLIVALAIAVTITWAQKPASENLREQEKVEGADEKYRSLEAEITALTQQVEQLTKRVELLELEIQALKALLAQKAPGTIPAQKVTNEIESIPQVKEILDLSRLLIGVPVVTEDFDLTKEYQPQLMKLKQKFLIHNGKLQAKGYYTDFMNSQADTVGLRVQIVYKANQLSIMGEPRAYIVKIENKSYLGVGYIYYKATLNSFKLDNRRRVAFIIKEIVIPEILPTINVFPDDVKISGIFLYVSYFHKDFTDESASAKYSLESDEIQIWIPYSIYSAYMRNEITDQEFVEKSAILVMSDNPDIAPVRIQVKLSD